MDKSLGAFLACIIVAPFLKGSQNSETCQLEASEANSTMMTNYTSAMGTEIGENRIFVPFTLVGVGILIVSMAMFYLYSRDIMQTLLRSSAEQVGRSIVNQFAIKLQRHATYVPNP